MNEQEIFLAYVRDMTDLWGQAYEALLGDSCCAHGCGNAVLPQADDWGASSIHRKLKARTSGDGHSVHGLGDAEIVPVMLDALSRHDALSDTGGIARGRYYNEMAAFCGCVMKMSRRWGLDDLHTLDDFLTHYNVTSIPSYRCMVRSSFADMYVVVTNNTLKPHNVQAPAVEVYASTATSGAFESLTSVDASKYAGLQTPRLRVTGFTGKGGRALVMGTGRGNAGEYIPSTSWEAVVTADGVYPLMSPVPGVLMLSVTGIGAPAVGSGKFEVLGAAGT